MAVSVEFVCDRCHEPITTARMTLEFVHGGDQWAQSPFTGKPSIDLCAPCCTEVFAAIRLNTTPEAAPSNEVRQKPHDHSRA